LDQQGTTMKSFLVPWIALAGLITGHPLNSNVNTTTYEYDESHQLQRRASPGDFYLRILPLGASIVWGYTSVDGNGYIIARPLTDTNTAKDFKISQAPSRPVTIFWLGGK